MQNTHVGFQAFTPATANIYRQPQRRLMRANPRGTVEVISNLGFPHLTKDLSFSYIPALPPCFSCMNKGHLKWFGLETKEGFWGMNATHRDQLEMCVYPSAGLCSLSLISPVLWQCLNMAFTRDVISCYSLFCSLAKWIIFFSWTTPSAPGACGSVLFPPLTCEAAPVISTQHQFKLIWVQMGGKLLKWNSLQAFSTYLVT